MSYHMELSTGLLERPHNMVAGFLRVGEQERARQKSQCLLYPSLGR